MIHNRDQGANFTRDEDLTGALSCTFTPSLPPINDFPSTEISMWENNGRLWKLWPFCSKLWFFFVGIICSLSSSLSAFFYGAKFRKAFRCLFSSFLNPSFTRTGVPLIHRGIAYHFRLPLLCCCSFVARNCRFFSPSFISISISHLSNILGECDCFRTISTHE